MNPTETILPGRTPATTHAAESVAEALLGRTLRPSSGTPRPALPPARRGGAVTAGGARQAGPPVWSVDGAGPVELDADDEQAVQAACGLMEVHGRATGAPEPLVADYVSTVTGVLAAQGATAALLAARRGHPRARVRTSLAQGALLAVTQYLAAATAEGPQDPAPGGTGLATLTTADGVLIEIETLDPLAWSGFWQRLGVRARTAGRGWLPFQQRFATAACPLPAELRAAVRAHGLRAVRQAGEAHGVSVAEAGEATAAPRDLAPWTVEPARPSDGLSRGAPPGRSGTAAGAGPLPLSGLRVVESARRVQGPMAGHVLRLLGADVVRVEPPGGDPMRGLPPLAGGCSVRFSALNHGKRVAEADLTTRRGRDTVRELVSRADVFLHNWAPGKARTLGLDAGDLHAVAPRLVYASASGFGAALGPTPPTGTDYLAQVHGGLAAALRPVDRPPAPSLMTVTDVLGGLVLAQAVLAGLLAREETRRGCRVASSLLSAAALVPRPPRRVRLTPLDRPLPTADGLLHLGAEARRQPGEVARAVLAAGPASVAGRLRTGGTEEWLAGLREAGLPAVRVRTDLAALATDPAFGRAVLPPDERVPYARPASPWTFEEDGR
ncbi:CoA transferase [Streptomyces nitrosporeus]|uniref:CoA transferase n=1 Tax=Streptomyces nitrosporeus TaxID=28894 RepID=UPI0039A0AA02